MSKIDLSKLLSNDSTPSKMIQEQTRKLERKWEPSGLLEGLKRETDRRGMSVLLENQAQHLIMESSTTNPNGANSEEWAGVALPLVRKIFGEIAAKEFVSVQPMNLPSGLVFYMDFKYGTTTGFRTTTSSLYGDTTSSLAPAGGLYGDGKFGYTINNSTLSGLTITGSQAISASIGFSGDPTSLWVYSVPVSSFTNPDLLGARAFIPSGTIAGLQPTYTTVSGGNVNFVAANSGSIAGIFYQTQPVSSARGDFEDRTGANINIPEIEMDLRSEPIVAKTRKLKATWTPELAQDLNAYHTIDAEAELTAMLSEYISLEIDQEILDMLILGAQSVDYWSAQIGQVYQGGAFASQTNISGQAWTNMTWFQTLGQKIQRMSNKIHQLTMRGGANFLVCSPDVATILEVIPGFTADTNGDQQEFAAGVSQIGSFKSRYKVYKNPYMQTNIILVGFKGTNFLETGAAYCPYVPLIMTPLVYDPTNFTPRRGVMTRYAKKMMRPEFYGKIFVQGLNTI